MEIDPLEIPIGESAIDRDLTPHAFDLSEAVEPWRDGKLLVMVPTSLMPARCVKCNSIENLIGKRLRLICYRNRWSILWLVPGILSLIVMTIIDRKRIVIFDVGLCKEHHEKRVRELPILFLSIVLAVMLSLAGLRTFPSDSSAENFFRSPAVNIACGITATLLLVVFKVRSRILRWVATEGDMRWFTGCSPEFLDSLQSAPAWYQPRK